MPPLITLPVLLFILLHAPTCSTATDTISAGQALTAGGNKLVSGNGKFALGFFSTGGKSPNNDATTQQRWYVGIWFDKVPKVTPVWVANRETPITVPTSSELTISGDGNLAIINRTTKSTVWSSQANMSTNNTAAVLLDNGNLVLHDGANASDVLWQSFDHPSDTLLPGAKIGRNKLTGLNRRLVSNKNSDDPAPGSYSLELDPSGASQYILSFRNSSTYWSSGEWNGQYFNSMPEMAGQRRLHLGFEFVNNSQEEYLRYTILDERTIARSVVDVSGQHRQFFWFPGSQDWVAIYALPKAQCDVFAFCGPFAVCDDITSPNCNCMKGFSVKSRVDWELDDLSGGCVRNIALDCGRNQTRAAVSADKFYPVSSIRLPDNAQYVEAVGTVDECGRACLNNCSCTAYAYSSSRCFVWLAELLNVKKQQQQSNDTSATGETLYLRLSAKEVMQGRRNSKRGMTIRAAVGASVGFVFVMTTLAIWVIRRRWCNSAFRSDQDSGGIVAFRYIDLQRATKNFTEKMGEGGFGSVFKGFIPDSSTTVAVKRLDGARQGEKQFRAEVSSIGIIQHINLVKLLGFCCEGDNRLLVYEHMQNHSLDIHLFRSNDMLLAWSTRYQIALGVARGLAYLHESCHDCIIHCDIKPENILLDASFVPKIADFGMAKLMGRGFSRVLTTMRGTVGYLAPEWISGVAITPKVDVYSYGMVLFEIVSGRRNAREEHSSSNGDRIVCFPVEATCRLVDGDAQSLVDRRLCDHVDAEEVERVCRVACWCIQDDECDRPTMGEVVQALEGVVELNMPPMPRLLQAIVGNSGAKSM